MRDKIEGVTKCLALVGLGWECLHKIRMKIDDNEEYTKFAC